MVQLNADSSILAVKNAAGPKIVWIYPVPAAVPFAVLVFQENVKQILWHPSKPNILVIVTAQRQTNIFV